MCPLDKIGSFEQALIAYFNRDHADLMAKINVRATSTTRSTPASRRESRKFKATQTW